MADAPSSMGFASDAPRPPIGFSIDLPEHWTVLDLDPHTRDAWLDGFLEQRLASRAQGASERGPARTAMLQLLNGLHREGVFLAAILAAEVAGELISASMTLAWRRPDLGGGRLDVEALRQVFLRAPESVGEERAFRRVERLDLPAGPAVKVVSRETARLLTIAKVRLAAMTQYFVPVPHENWFAVVTATTGVRELEAGVEALADGVVNTLTFQT